MCRCSSFLLSTMKRVLLFALLYVSCVHGILPPYCRFPKAPGTCNMRMWRFGYDTREKRCVPFVYFGCEGNANNFATMLQCQTACEIYKN
ncbi:Kunitz/Bovine pancreatic trypsin inhibitor domain protein [Ancylostoma duodenale]|uniref:Kunitz/Bovine pancreatic trypsin inhibitor domain protein n=1 Tax=Ancylostoma duodenale TaxID=51022 RepID=A0A0C2GTI3_9BILA|nr:Kunitz/Bovine pancreatic trypsin inhibitor domain protein [Ancylostoma duodenale]